MRLLVEIGLSLFLTLEPFALQKSLERPGPPIGDVDITIQIGPGISARDLLKQLVALLSAHRSTEANVAHEFEASAFVSRDATRARSARSSLIAAEAISEAISSISETVRPRTSAWLPQVKRSPSWALR